MTPVRLLLTTQSGQTSKYTTSVSDSTFCFCVAEKKNSGRSPDAGQYLAVAAKLDLCTDHCGKGNNRLLVVVLFNSMSGKRKKKNPQAIAG